jgi:hypothetical protein
MGLIGGHPYPTMPSPTIPSPASFFTSGQGNSARSQYPLITGSTSSSTKSRVRRKNLSSSRVSWSAILK